MTARGAAAAEDLVGVINEIQGALFGELSGRERSILLDLLDRVGRA